VTESKGSAPSPAPVMIAILHMGQVCSQLASWAAWVAANEKRYPLTIQWFGNDKESVPVSSNRNRILRDTPRNFSGVLMLDADTVPHPQTTDLPLLGKDIVLAPTPIYRPTDERGPILVNLIPYGAESGNMDGATLPVGSDAVIKIKEGGTGCIWIGRAVLDHPDMRAPFSFAPDDDGVTQVGEDHAFCRRATDAGFDIWGAMRYVMGHNKSINLAAAYNAFNPVEGLKLRLIVTGTGRNGSGYAASRLTAAGLACGHEVIFMYRGLDAAKERLARFTQFRADSSWMAAPYLDDPFLDRAIVIHQVRHPGKVLASWLRDPTQATPRYWQFLLEHLPQLEQIEDDVTRCAARYVLWNRMIEEKGAGRILCLWPIESGGVGEREMLQGLIDTGILPDGALLRPYLPNRGTNAHAPGKEPQFVWWDQIQEPWQSEIREMAKRYGYSWERE